MALLSLALLGSFDCRTRTGAVLTFPTRKVRALLAFLAARPGRDHSRDALAALFWGEQPDDQARANLRKALSRLRQALPVEARACLVAGASGVAIERNAIDVDVHRFECLAAEGTPETLERAAALHRGPFLDAFADLGETFDEWLTGERRRIEERLRQVLLRLLDHYGVTGAVDRAIQVALRLLTLDPLQEAVHRTLMRLYLVQDRAGSAIEQYRRCRDVLARELGVAPSDQTEAIRAEILGLRPGSPDGPGPVVETDTLPRPPAGLVPVPRRPGPSGRPSIAVLAFTTAGDEEVPRHLGDSLAEEIATELGRFLELDVIAPASALAYRSATVPAERAGGELGATHVIMGRLRRAGAQLRVTVGLVETGSGRQVWAERYACASGDTVDTQDAIVRRVVATVAGQIEDARLAATRRQRPEHCEAYDLCLQGHSALRRLDASAIRDARALFERAAAQDPRLGRAYSGLALTLWAESTCFSWKHWVFVRKETLRLARTAVELDDRDHRARCILGIAHLYARDYAAARHQLARALDLNPNDASVLAHVSFGMALIGEHDLAVETGRTALRLHPHHPDWYAGFVGIALFGARRYEEAIRTMAPAPEAFCTEPAFIAAAHAHLGARAEAARYRPTVERHFQNRLKRATAAPGSASCIDWLLASDPFQLGPDVEHYRGGLTAAGFA
jgi:DNA-binding SARP family transcriptional activator/TolB-like protein/Tfp pilus assembly protein PilF